MKRVDILVVGGGVTGLTTAWALHEAGLKCAVVDAGQIDGQGQPIDDHPGHPIRFVPAPVLPFWRLSAGVNALADRAREIYPELVVRLGQSTGVDCEYRKTGLVLVGEVSPAGLAWLADTRSGWRQGSLSDFEPGLTRGESPAVLLEDVCQIRTSRLVRALTLALKDCGVEVISGRPLRRLKVAGNVVLGAELDLDGDIRADAVIVAAGSQTSNVLVRSGLDGLMRGPASVPHLLFNPGQRLLSHPVNAGDIGLVPRHDGRVVVSLLQTPEPGQGMTPFDHLLTRAANWLPALNRFDLEARWLAPSPESGDGLPAIGAYPWIRGLWINAGHSHGGPGLAPAAAELLIDQLNGGPALGEFEVRPVAPGFTNEYIDRMLKPSC